MIIKDISLARRDSKAVLSATCKIRKVGWDELYLSFDESVYDYLVEDASPFAAALLIPAMRRGENLIIKGSISKQLFEGLHRIMDAVLQWDIGLQRIAVKADNLVADSFEPRQTATFFSGGVDSFYTYLHHKRDKRRSNRVDGLIVVNGYDISLLNPDLWHQTRINMEAVAASERVEGIFVDSNLRLLIEPLMLGDRRWDCPWDWVHGGCLAAVGLSLRKQYRQIYIPSSFAAEEQRPWGTHPEVDKFWGTEALQFKHDGTEATRVDKVLNEVAGSPVALKHLRVCYYNTGGAYNCGECEKCLRTMVSLFAAGVLEQAETFPNEINADKLAAGLVVRGEDQTIFHGERQNLAVLRERNLAPDLQAALVRCINQTVRRQKTVKEKVRSHVLNIHHKLVYAEAAYFGGHMHSIVSTIARRFH